MYGADRVSPKNLIIPLEYAPDGVQPPGVFLAQAMLRKDTPAEVLVIGFASSIPDNPAEIKLEVTETSVCGPGTAADILSDRLRLLDVLNGSAIIVGDDVYFADQNDGITHLNPPLLGSLLISSQITPTVENVALNGQSAADVAAQALTTMMRNLADS
jgi:hypothetical protein